MSHVSLCFFLAKTFGVTEVPLEVVNFIAHATQTRLRTVLEKVSFIAQHRMDSCKVGKDSERRLEESRKCVSCVPYEYIDTFGFYKTPKILR